MRWKIRKLNYAPLIPAAFNIWRTTGSIVLCKCFDCGNFAKIHFKFALAEVSQHHAVDLISVYGLPHGTALSMHAENGIWWFCLGISIPEWVNWSQRPPAVFQSRSNKRSDPLTHTHSQPCCVMFSICHSINVLISSHLSKLPMTCFVHTWLQICARTVWQQVLRWHLF